MKMCQAFAQLGHDVCLITPGLDPTGFEKEALWHHYGIATPFPIEWRPTLPPLRYHRFALSVSMSIHRTQPELVFGRHLGAVSLAARYGCQRYSRRHGPIRGWANQFYWALLRDSRSFRKLVVITEPLKRIFEDEWDLSDEGILVAPDGVDLERFEKLPTADEARVSIEIGTVGRPLVGYAGHLYPGRGIDVMLIAARELPGVDFLVAGGNPEEVRYHMDLARNEDLTNVTFTGFIPNADLPLFLAACDILLMPYQRSVSVAGGGDTSSG